VEINEVEGSGGGRKMEAQKKMEVE